MSDVWRYTPGGRVKHRLLAATDAVAVCGFDAVHFDWWLGTGSQAEYERAAGLPGCRNCVRRGGDS